MAFSLLVFGIFSDGFFSGEQFPKEEGVALSAPEGRRNRPPNLKRVSIIPKNPDIHSVLAVQTEVEDPDLDAVTFRYRWTLNRKLVSEEATLSLNQFKQGNSVSVEVIPYDGKIEGASKQADHVLIQNNPPIISGIIIEPETPHAGERIQAKVNSSDADGDMVFYSYRWTINGQDVEGNDNKELRPGLVRSADRITVVVTPGDSFSEGAPKASKIITVKNNPPKILSRPPSGLNEEWFEYQMVSEDPDQDTVSYFLQAGPSGMSIDSETGRLSWKVAPLPEGRMEIAVGVKDGKGGLGEQRFTIQTKQ